MTEAALAPGVHRVGDQLINYYLVEDRDGLTLVDAGLPAFWPGLVAAVGRIGRTPEDIRAVLITHGHLDHIGLAERLRTGVGAEIWVHQADAPILGEPLRTSKYWRAERSLLPYALRRPTALRGPLHLARRGALRTRAVRRLRTFTGRAVLDVPGRPLAVPVPGHTVGSTAYLFADHGVVFTGDALVTHDSVTGERGPRLISPAFTQNSAAALGSLRTLAELDTRAADLVLTGHGDPWPHGLAEAVARAQDAYRTRH